MTDFAHLNHYIPIDAEGVSDAWKRTLGRLGDYTRMVVQTMNMRPSAALLLAQTDRQVLVRLVLPNDYVVLRISPEADLSGNVFFGRMVTAHNLPGARIMQHDLSRAMVPFAYMVESYVCGVAATQITESHLLRAAARQSGRILRRLQRVTTPGWGRPGPLGRWPTPDWTIVLRQMHAAFAPPPSDALVFDEPTRNAIADILNDPRLSVPRPTLMHGAFGPSAGRYTVGEHVQLEAFVDPGMWVGGDTLLDMAWGLEPSHSEEWRTGLLEGFTGAVPLAPTEIERLHLLRILVCYWSACLRYMRAEDHEPARAQLYTLLQSPPSAP